MYKEGFKSIIDKKNGDSDSKLIRNVKKLIRRV
jgi:hypothetical protein